MSKLDPKTVVAEALALLDDVGLDAVSTRQLAKRLGVEQPSLYWHFRRKEDLLTAMAEAAMEPHARAPLPESGDDWREWFVENMRSFRRTLLVRRDGARLHAGSRPKGGDLDRIAHKLAFLEGAAKLLRRDAAMALFAASRFTIGSVLEEQADASVGMQSRNILSGPQIDYEASFEAGLALIMAGLSAKRRAPKSC